MDRRQFLGAAAVSAAGMGAIGWLGHLLFTSLSVPDALRQASRLGKPLLVLVFPEGKGRQYHRGQIFGALLNHGGIHAYLDLALCELTCATMDDLRHHEIDVPGEPLMVLLESGFPRPTATPIDVGVVEDLPDGFDVGPQRVDRMAEERMYAVASALHDGLFTTPLAARARYAESRLPRPEVDSLHAALEAGRIPDHAALDRGAAIVRAFGHAERNGDLLAALADAAALRLQGAPPAGAKWARATGCGTLIEGEPDDRGYACGMGFVPDVSKRFLWFYTE
ncbi:MAG TPA: twin-arginine translocation signal domain-containing protein [Planctomycetota bacterium]|nr:twin-arginine translocation signal domain-containing protein [Planctomycetota bacterium]